MLAEHLKNAMRLFHTVRHLRPIQIAWRFRPKPRLNRERLLPQGVRSARGRWTEPYHPKQTLLSETRHSYLNQTLEVTGSADWNDASRPMLWLYNLHYFADLNAQDADQRKTWHRRLIARWIDENPPAEAVGWDPFPTSLRIVNWIKWALAGNDLEEDWQRSMALQARHLSQSIEYHLLGNHLLANAKALVFAGCHFAGPEADNWFRSGLKILEREFGEQVLADGGHFELSSMYQLLCIEDLLDLINLASLYPHRFEAAQSEGWRRTVVAMLSWSETMTHPDGELSYFNDAAMGIAPKLCDLTDYAERLGIAQTQRVTDLIHLEASGYVRAGSDDATALLDVGRIGADYIPGHGHADTLSFELSVLGQRVIVNTGTSVYAPGERRKFERSTGAHSTVEIDGKSSSEVWDSFRVARRAYPFDLEINKTTNRTTVTCSHDGYRRLKGRTVHTRSWRLEDRRFTITDRLSGSYRVAKSRFYLHPEVAVIQSAKGRILLNPPGLPTISMDIVDASFEVEAANWSAGFGKTIPTRVVVLELTGTGCSVELTW